jgi:hypothetical protein
VRVFADEDVYNELKRLLAAMRHDVVSPIDLGIRGAGDELCFLHAASDSRALLTHNEKDYSLLHRAWSTWAGHWGVGRQPLHFGVLIVPHQDLLDVDSAANRIHSMLQDPTALINAFYRLDRSGRWRSYS